MSDSKNQKRVLALDVRPRSFGYVLFEGPERLLDWGARSFRKGVNAVRIPLAQKIEALVDECDPTVVVAKEAPRRKKINSAKRRKMLDVIVRKAKHGRIPVRVLGRSAVRAAFASNGLQTKHQVASALAERFAELAPILPPKRKPWQSEDYRTSIFDAAALGTAYFARCAKRALREAPAPSESS